jgi:hypothetical protein
VDPPVPRPLRLTSPRHAPRPGRPRCLAAGPAGHASCHARPQQASWPRRALWPAAALPHRGTRAPRPKPAKPQRAAALPVRRCTRRAPPPSSNSRAKPAPPDLLSLFPSPPSTPPHRRLATRRRRHRTPAALAAGPGPAAADARRGFPRPYLRLPHLQLPLDRLTHPSGPPFGRRRPPIPPPAGSGPRRGLHCKREGIFREIYASFQGPGCKGRFRVTAATSKNH